MSSNQKSNNKSSTAVVAIPVVIIVLPLLISLFSFVFAQDSQDSQPFLEKPASQYKECVRDTEFMRHNHWVLLQSVREDVVRYGIRSEISLNKCRECHKKRERFCKKCHDATSLTPDCFGCHYYP